MKWNILVAVALMLAVSVLGASLVLYQPGPKVTGAVGIDADFYAIVHLSPNSVDHVVLDSYEDFTCPACQQLEAEGLPRILAAHDARITVRRHYLAGPATAPSAKILYDLAGLEGRGEAVAQTLFAARLEHGDDAANRLAVKKIAQRFGLQSEFDAALRDGSGLVKIRQEWARTGGKIAFFRSSSSIMILLSTPMSTTS